MDSDKMAVDAAPPESEPITTPQPANSSVVTAQTNVEPLPTVPPASEQPPLTNGKSTPTPHVSENAVEDKPERPPNAPPVSFAAENETVLVPGGLLLEPAPMAVDEPEATTSQQGGRPASMDPNNYAPVDRPLNVTDALSYLDAVKVQFQDQPDVYNHFLDIMKEFKNELIDTPGVIKRVSHLFNGHPALIQGFNTFLPVGYRIECSTDAHDANYITVTTPSGTMIQTTNNGPGRGPIQWSTTVNGSLPRSDAVIPNGTGFDQVPPVPSSPEPRMYGVDGQAIEPAVQYVQKIKQRCDPDTYRQFLDILSRYHHKSDTINEEDVSRQIARLFKNDPDLRADFRVFMPDRSQQLLDDNIAFGPSGRTGTPVEGSRSRRKLDVVANGPPAAVSVSGLSQKRKRKATDKEREREKEQVAMKSSSSSKQKPRHAASQDLTPQSYNAKHAAGPSSPRHANSPLPISTVRAPPVADETHFFDRVKRALDNRDVYNEFLKVVNLFTQGYIDTARLVKESRNFLGDAELFRQFKEILGWDERKDMEHFFAESQSNGWVKPTMAQLVVKPGRHDLHMKYGSYRRVSDAEANVTCSGRDEMCRSVLNDEWVSHPTWSSEDSGFIAHKKNIYEEALHRSEEERHEYDFHIEAIVRTITMLEPINNKILQLNPDERGSFKLKPNLGGSWKAIHTRVVKKIYGRDAGLDVIQAMQDTPALAIPVVLARLKQKEEEWKRAQREWNKVWREVDARNYTKSLDHQSISFKADDKKAMTTKTFVNQIEAAREEQMAKRASLIDPLFARTRPRHQLEFLVEDMQVMQDAMKLTFSFLDRTQQQINVVERKRIESFLRSFIPLFFVIDPVAFNSAFVVVQETVADSDVSDDVASNVDEAEISSTGTSSSRNGRNKKAVGVVASSGGDLRKKLLKSEQAKSTKRTTRAQEAASPSASRFASPAPNDDEARGESSGQNRKPRRNIFFTNTIFYTLMRLIELLYSRLSHFKTIAAKLASADPKSRRPNNGIIAGLSAQAQAELNLAGDRAAHAEHYYDLMLESCERLFDNEIEQTAFEDQMRYMFGTKDAYKVFTIDKVIGSVIKQVQSILADGRSQDLLEILKRERTLASPTAQDQINNRRNAEKVLGPDENLFRIDWLSDSKTMTMQLIGKDDSSFDDSEALTGRWQSYIDSYVSSDYTDGVSQARVKRPYLRRNLPIAVRETPPDVTSKDGLEIKVCVRTYRLFFVSKTEDFLWRYRSKEEVDKHATRLKAKNELRRTWAEKSS
ncbi:histone deacetylase complex, SIN3 component [Crucibulum laeve]|uniref:Histone deacetylase complex, SIN3 component n=1 Tax=Crucibulum laeve TaxID=68775 RepID=A0A5C3M9W7_9AGAR|nr:histone deacetylase complex, SIN3 component [Crucibulum laeve]